MDNHLSYTYSAATHTGDRETNQDNLSLCGELPFTRDDESYRRTDTSADLIPAVFAVCDGIGSYEDSAESAIVTLEALAQSAQALSAEEDKIDWVYRTVDEIGNQVRGFLRDNEKKGGNTLSFLVFDESRFYFANIGDSPAFILRRNGESVQEISLRHNLATYHRLIGKPVTLDDSRCLIYSVGANTEELSKIVNLYVDELSSGDSFLICSDGITNELTEEEITQMLQSRASADEFVSIAASQPGSDNCTAIVIYID